MKQEDYNEMMRRYPWEVSAQDRPMALPACPGCSERYMGDGKALCIECAAKEFSAGCKERGLCPRCVNIGEYNGDELDAFGDCSRYGHRQAT